MITRVLSLRSFAIASVAALALSACGGAPPKMPPKSNFTGPYPSDYAVHGVDVSKYQGDIDWRSAREAGVDFAFIKATEGGDHVDEKFVQNWNGAKAAGIPRGAYHFVWWCRDPRQEIEQFKRIVPVERDALPPVLDVEATPDSKTCKRKLHREEVLADMRIMLQEMERHYGKRPIIYVTVDFYQHVMHPEEFADYPVWVRSVKHSPPVNYPGRRWAFWQYQSDGYVPGIRGKVDRNAFAGSRAQFVAWLENKR
jgi:lysozyme